MLLNEMRLLMTRKLRTAGVGEEALAVRLLLEDRLTLAPLTVPLFLDRELTQKEERQLLEDTKRLCAKEPLQYVLGTQVFWDMTLAVDPSVLIPRAETEELAQEAVRYLKETGKRKVLDLCTGSGVLALAVKKHVPDAEVTGSDLSGDALAVARRNAAELALDIEWKKCDLLEGIRERFDLILCNPPYIPTDDLEKLEESVRDYEPHMALDGGEDGLCFYRRLSSDAPLKLKEGGALFLEVGIGQADDVCTMLRDAFEAVTVKEDMQGIGRMILATGRKEIP